MRRWAAILLLGLALVYLGATGVDFCVEETGSDCAPICHLLCSDGCATAPMPEPPGPPPADPLPRPRFSSERLADLVSLCPEPEKDPPRA
ncbi:MAG TPA: hypothetical protein DHV93_06135 [Holophagaceae bacterium]|jgi:hypothetical protein|nr:hypothetical protein [Holophagaceae bacterium]